MFEPPLIAPDELTNVTGSAANSISIRVLILEDRAEDAELMAHELRRSWLSQSVFGSKPKQTIWRG